MKASAILTIAISVIFAGALIAHGGWLPPGGPTSPDVTQPLDIGSAGQSKSGGLILNSGGAAAYGLVVDGSSAGGGQVGEPGGSQTTGLVGIGTNNPFERLDVVGDIQISGLIKPKGATGSNDQALSLDANGMQWKNRTAWTTLMGAPGSAASCADTTPPQCAAGYNLYANQCFDDTVNSGYSIYAAVCYKSF